MPPAVFNPAAVLDPLPACPVVYFEQVRPPASAGVSPLGSSRGALGDLNLSVAASYSRGVTFNRVRRREGAAGAGLGKPKEPADRAMSRLIRDDGDSRLTRRRGRGQSVQCGCR